jgi:hypothetical protein
MTQRKVVHGDDLLYRFFQDALRSQPGPTHGFAGQLWRPRQDSNLRRTV